jgi:hypothetical protein
VPENHQKKPTSEKEVVGFGEEVSQRIRIQNGEEGRRGEY